ncbi:hypothetical protein KEM54_001786 [Ascosphaera aggregata]|nr:hypothetical protein KEM54_001786 [Ascosphaera aggregata]
MDLQKDPGSCDSKADTVAGPHVQVDLKIIRRRVGETFRSYNISFTSIQQRNCIFVLNFTELLWMLFWTCAQWTQIDAIYHTSLVFGGVEYYFGNGIQQSAPGATHHGQPMQIVPMGTCHLSLDVIIEYMESLAQTYTEEVR